MGLIKKIAEVCCALQLFYQQIIFILPYQRNGSPLLRRQPCMFPHIGIVPYGAIAEYSGDLPHIHILLAWFPVEGSVPTLSR